MDEREFKYDVAFSFLEQDEGLATEINDLIQDRVNTFLYSERQPDIAGTDGEETFSTVFGRDARLVVILYRAGWGDTTWTRIEKTAIQNRVLDNGYDFTLFIPLDIPPQLPEWLPRARIWYNVGRFGAGGAAEAIETRLTEAGGNVGPESLADKAARYKRERESAERRRRFLHSEDSVRAAQDEYGKLLDQISRKCQDISDPSAGLEFRVIPKGDYFMVYGGQYTLYVQWSQLYVNTLDNSSLKVILIEETGHSRAMCVPCEQLSRIADMRFHFDLQLSGATGWREVDGGEEFYSTTKLAEHCLHQLLDCIRERKSGEVESQSSEEWDIHNHPLY